MKKETQVDGLSKTTFVKEELENGGEVGIIDEQNITPHLKHNKELYNHNDGYSKSRAWKRVASIPTLALQIWAMEETGDNNWFRIPKEIQNKIFTQDRQMQCWGCFERGIGNCSYLETTESHH